MRLAELKDLWFYYAGIYNGLPLDDRTALEQVLGRAAARRRGSRAIRLLPGLRRCTGGGRRADHRPLLHDRGRRRDRFDRRARASSIAHGGVAGGHSLYVKDGRLRYAFNWVGTHIQDVVADRDVAPGRHIFTAEFAMKGKSEDPAMPGFAGTLNLYMDDEQVGSGEIVTQPGVFCLVGDGICVGRDSASPVTPDYTAPFRFTGGTIEKVVVDVSGEPYIDHEAQVRGLVHARLGRRPAPSPGCHGARLPMRSIRFSGPAPPGITPGMAFRAIPPLFRMSMGRTGPRRPRPRPHTMGMRTGSGPARARS